MNPNSILENSFLGSKWFNPDYLFTQGSIFFHKLFAFNVDNWPHIVSVYHTALLVFSLFFISIISYTAIRLFEIRKKEHNHLHHEIAEYAHHKKEREKKLHEADKVSKNERWVKTLNYLFSQHPSDWKLAIIEADSMLEALLDQLGFKGESLGDKLKSATQPSRTGGEKVHNMSSAWSAHAIRNKIAHEGTSFELSQHEAKKAIALYEHIFREFGYI